jgi:hypothetical protein
MATVEEIRTLGGNAEDMADIWVKSLGSNYSMATAMKGASEVLGQMNRNISRPGLQRIAMEFEKENDIMEQRQEIMDDAMDDATGVDEEAEGDEIVDQVLEEIGVNLKQSVSIMYWYGDRRDANGLYRWVRLRKDFKVLLLLRGESRKLSEAVILETMIYRRD